MCMPWDGSALTIAMRALMEIESTALSCVKVESPNREVENVAPALERTPKVEGVGE
jgi:hypothetical protein